MTYHVPTKSVLEASHVVRHLSKKLMYLSSIAEQVEDCMSVGIEGNSDLSPDAIRTLQSVDYLRQSLEDISQLLDNLETGTRWSDQSVISLRNLAENTRLADTIADLHLQSIDQFSRPARDQDDIDLF